ncbi:MULTISPECIES: extracellular solute-binding protein [Rhodomicrobium]|uniref:extracellular solute-binding protein n=1 Tax=Rhodomicrobium TaxID=1068 RepID=UPI000F73C254|nr:MULTISPECIES: extracellular solute-binding protein [Rhodomicrobium]
MRRPQDISGLALTIAAAALLCFPVSAQTSPPEADAAAAPPSAEAVDPAVTAAPAENATPLDAAPAIIAEPAAPEPDLTDPEPATGAANAEPAEPAAQAQSEPSTGTPLVEPAAPAQAESEPETAAPAQVQSEPEPAAPAQVQVEPEPAEPPTGAAAVAAPAAPPPAPLNPKDVTLKIATWSGAYGESQERAYFEPFTARFGYQINAVTYDGSYDVLKGQGAKPEWSLVDIDGETAARACAEKLLEPLDASLLQSAPDGASAAEDFLPGAIQPCALASVAWSAVIVFDKTLKRKPATLEDFFNTSKIPGKRLLPKQPRYSLELALMADGVQPGEVYKVLSAPEGQDRAFAKLSTIKNDILWWDKPSDVFGRIVKKEAAMGLAFNGRAFMAIVGGQQPLEILWDHQIYAFDYWAIPRGAAHQEAAKEFLRFATTPGPLADQTRWMPYGPARRSAVKLVGKHAELDLEMKPYLPTHEPNLKSALAFDGGWWGANEAALTARFEGWLAGRQTAAPKEAPTSQ